MKLKHISGWLLIALAIYVYLKETAFGYWMYIANQTNSGGISFSMYLPFGLFALGAFIIGLGMYILIFFKIFKINEQLDRNK